MPRIVLVLLVSFSFSFVPVIGSHTSIVEQMDLADSLSKAGRHDSATTIGLHALSQSERQSGADSLVAEILYRLGKYWYSGRKFDSAQTYWRQSLTIRRGLAGGSEQDIATNLYYLGAAHLRGEDYAIAESYLTQALTLREKLFGDDHLEVGRALIAYSNVKKRLEKYREAEATSKRADRIFDANLPAGDYERYKPLFNLGDIYHFTARPKLAVEYYTRALEILVAALGANHSATASGQARLAKEFYVMGRYSEAERMYERAIKSLETRLGHKDKGVTAEKVNLGLVLMARGDFVGAIDLFQAGLDVYQGDTTKRSRWVSNCLRYLAEAQMGLGDYDAAENLLQRALQEAKDVLGEKHSEVARASGSLADFLRWRGDNEQADSLYRYAIEVSENAFGEANAFTVKSLNGLGLSLLAQGRLDESELVLKEGYEVVKGTFGSNHPELAKSLEYLAQNSRAKGNYANCLSLIHEAYTIRTHNMNMLAPVLAEPDALLYAEYQRKTVSSYLTNFFEADINSKEVVNSVAQAILTTKGPVSDIVFLRNRMWRAHGDDKLQALLNDYREARRILAQRFVAGPTSGDATAHGLMLDSLDNNVRRLETELARKGADQVLLTKLDLISPTDIAARLLDGSTLVEYLRFSYTGLNEDQDEDHYLALVLDKSGVRALRDLGPAARIDTAVGRYRTHLNEMETQLAPPSDVDLNVYKTISGGLRKLVLEPIQPFIADSSSLIISLDGALNTVSFAGLPLDNGQYLIEQYPIQYVIAGRDLLDKIQKDQLNEGLLAIGDVDFDASPQMRSGSQIDPARLGSELFLKPFGSPECDQLLEQPLTRIPGTRREVERLASSWQEDHDTPVYAFYGAEATEDVVKSRGPGSRFIHLATHGYFIGDNCLLSKYNSLPANGATIPRSAPLLYSGLYLAGANLRGQGSEEMGIDDGILTAEEVSTLNLEGCQMVVLSACESGLGDVISGEGIYGLRRSFQMAGAQSVVSSLWRVPDATTAQLMKHLFGLSQRPISEILREESVRLLGRLRRKGQPDHPYNWAAFVAIGVSR